MIGISEDILDIEGFSFPSILFFEFLARSSFRVSCVHEQKK